MIANKVTKLCLKKNPVSDLTIRYYSQKKGFLGGIIDNLKDEFSKNKEMNESIKKFREEAKKLEQTDALQEARKKYKALEDERNKSAKIIKETLGAIGEKVKDSDITKKAVETSEKVFKKAQETASTISQQTQQISNTAAMKKVSENVKAIKQGLDDATNLSKIKPYQPPTVLRKRSDITPGTKVYESNTEAQGMVLHKDSKFYQSWQNFKDNNKYVNKLFDLKMKYDESENTFVRATRVLTDKFTTVFGGMFKSTEMSAVLTEITNVDPKFDTNEFIKYVQYDIIPNILESVARKELEILQDWCTETAFNILAHPIKQCEHLKLNYHNTILDVNNVDIAAGKIMEQGPVLVVTFNAQQIIYVTDASDKVVEGARDKIKRVLYVWALCRDQTELNPKSAWKLMECSYHASDLFI